jgi:hypothetical protein
LEPFTLLQSKLEAITDQKIGQLIHFIQQHDPSIIHQMIQIIISFDSIRPLHHHQIVELLSLIALLSLFPLNSKRIAEKHPFLVYHLAISGIFPAKDLSQISSNEFDFLSSSKLLESWQIPQCFRDRYFAKDFQLQEIRKYGYEQNSLGCFLKFDNLDSFQVRSTEPAFDYEQEISISVYDIPSHWTPPQQSILSVSAFYGSVACFKFIFLNGSRVSKSVTESSIKGGAEELIKICEREHGDFSECLPIAVEFYRNNIADWLLMNFDVSKFSFLECIESVNFPCILFLLSNSVGANTGANGGRTPLHLAALNECTGIITLLVEKGAEIDAKDKFGIHFIQSTVAEQSNTAPFGS